MEKVQSLKKKKTTLANRLQPGSQSEIPGPATSASPGYLLEIQILRPRPKPPESDALRFRRALCVLTSLSHDSDAR